MFVNCIYCNHCQSVQSFIGLTSRIIEKSAVSFLFNLLSRLFRHVSRLFCYFNYWTGSWYWLVFAYLVCWCVCVCGMTKSNCIKEVCRFVLADVICELRYNFYISILIFKAIIFIYCVNCYLILCNSLLLFSTEQLSIENPLL